MKTGKWSEEEVEQLNSYLASGLSAAEIASKIDRARTSVNNKINNIRMTPEEREARRKRQQEYRKDYSGQIQRWMHSYTQPALSERPTEEMLAERDARYSAPFRDLSAFAFGDPPIGYSALDKSK